MRKNKSRALGREKSLHFRNRQSSQKVRDKLDYFRTVVESLKIIWNNKYLWILGFFSAGFGILTNFSLNFKIDLFDKAYYKNFKIEKIFLLGDEFIATHIVSAILIALGILGIIILLVTLGCLSQGGLIYVVNQIKKKGKKSLGFKKGLCYGRKFFWRVLAIDVLFLISILLILGIFIGTPVALLLWRERIILAIILGALGGIISFILSFFALFILRYGVIFVVIENKGIKQAIRQSYRLFVDNFLATILMNILLWFVSLLLSSIYIFVFILLIIPFALIALILFFIFRSSAVSALSILFLFFGFAISILITGIISAFESTAWTLTFKQLRATKSIFLE